MDCYSYKEIHSTDNPIIPSLDLTIILMLEGNEDRFEMNDFILNLAGKTIFQNNKGFKKCNKVCNKENVDSTVKDLNLSYLKALCYSKNLNIKNVLILEEDAEIFDKTPYKWKDINNFISKDIYSILSLGSFSLFKNSSFVNFYNPSFGFFGATQGIIYNLSKLDKFIDLINNTNCNLGQFDSEYIKHIGMDNIFIYKDPMIVQTFPDTDNKKNWSKGGFFDNIIISMITNSHKILGTDKETKGWTIWYFMCKNYLWIFIFIIILIYYFIR